MDKVKYLIILMILTVFLTGCKGKDYKEAITFETNRQYQEAYKIYNNLGNYKDATVRASSCKEMLDLINEFQTNKKIVEEKNKEILQTISKAKRLIDGQEVPMDLTLITSMEKLIDEANAKIVEVIDIPQKGEDIKRETEKMKRIDYGTLLVDLTKTYEDLEKSIEIGKKVNAPTKEYIIECLGKIEEIIDKKAVTEENDPNGGLNKPGSYVEQIYFSSNLINQDSIIGNDVIEKGTQCGGSIEVYENTNDANKRNEYLASFDGTIFASGSHMVIGTIVIRTSNELKASEQKELEDKIIEALTGVEE